MSDLNTTDPQTAVTTTPVKKLRVAKKTGAATAPVAAKPVKEKIAKPVVLRYSFRSAYTGPSDGVRKGASKTKIDFDAFGTMTDASLSDRDEKNLAAFRQQFKSGTFERGNLDAGILRRLGERGCIEHVDGGEIDPKATFRLTDKGMGKAIKKAA